MPSLDDEDARCAMMQHEFYVTIEHTEQGVIAACDELNAVASGVTKEEALRNLEQSIEALMQDYGEEVKQRLRNRVLKVVEVA